MSNQACIPPEELVGFGALLQYWDTDNEKWIDVAGTKDLETPEDTTEGIDTTTGDNRSHGYKTNIPSPLSELGEVTYTMNFRASQWTKIVNMKASKRTFDWRIVLMNEEQTYMKFCAWIKTLKVNIPQEELVEADLGLMPTGAPTWDKVIQ